MLKLYLTTLILVVLVDSIWLGLVAQNFYQQQLSLVLKAQINWLPVVLFYLIFSFGLALLVVRPGIKIRNIEQVLIQAAVFGLVAYSTYDLTNWATLRNWPVLVTIVDLIWGVSLTTIVAASSYYLAIKYGFS